VTDYQRETRDAYRSRERARNYKHYNTAAWSWGRIATAREQRGIQRVLAREPWQPGDMVLDIPCGTGILAGVLNTLPVRVVASDISYEMMALGREEYREGALAGAVQADITRTPFASGTFAAVCVLGFLHRVPSDIKRAALREASALSSRLVIATCAIDTPLQRLKHRVLRLIRNEHIPAPAPTTLASLIADCHAAGLRVRQQFFVLPLLSAEIVLVLEKSAVSHAHPRT
jgi:SAM-dependent methyltransferase